MEQICTKVRDGFEDVPELQPMHEGHKCALSMLDIPAALAGAFDVPTWKQILDTASVLFEKLSLINWSLMTNGEVIIDRDESAVIGAALDAAGDVARLVAAGLPDGDPEPSTSPLDPAPWLLDLVSAPWGLIGSACADFVGDLANVNWAEIIPSEHAQDFMVGCDGECQTEACEGGKVLNSGDYDGVIEFHDWQGAERQRSWQLVCPAGSVPVVQFVSLDLHGISRVQTIPCGKGGDSCDSALRAGYYTSYADFNLGPAANLNRTEPSSVPSNQQAGGVVYDNSMVGHPRCASWGCCGPVTCDAEFSNHSHYPRSR
eukprot:SAG31_NODE_8545_length_1432_cov_1.476369_1_plen_316_part_00